MILLDTNVISEVMLASPSPSVEAWLAARPASDLATTTINIAEIRFGLARLPFGRRRAARETLFNSLIERSFGDRVFGFDQLAAGSYGELVASRERTGRPLVGFDALIAAIASSRGLGIATRDIRGFQGCGIDLINPWDDGAA
jgi:predicted nucleic acid-binding protein